ncbi:MAG: helicase, partial [Clostridiales bacterium]|nr:helicase [Clostridiales bacterium]
VEHQLETAQVEVTKPFAQEQELAEKLERLAELNALLNMDEKGDNALDMDDNVEVPTSETEVKERETNSARLEEKAANNKSQNNGIRQFSDAPAERVSIKAKLEAMKVKIAAAEKTDRENRQSKKGKEVTRII